LRKKEQDNPPLSAIALFLFKNACFDAVLLICCVVPRLMRIQDAAKYLSATTWQVETLLREKIIPSFVLGKRRVVDRLELDRYVERRNAMARTENTVPEKEEIFVSLEK
jgi:excisionase family DNA binding protein